MLTPLFTHCFDKPSLVREAERTGLSGASLILHLIGSESSRPSLMDASGTARSPEEIIRHIAAAFKHRTLPKDDAVFQSHTFEVDMQSFERLAQMVEWFDFPLDILYNNSIAPAYLTPKAFAWLLPAYMVVSVALYNETDTLTTSLITCLTPPDETDAPMFETLARELQLLGVDIAEESGMDILGADDELLELFMARAAVLTEAEITAVRSYLEFVDDAHGADFPAMGPRQALDRYWRGAVRPGE